MNNVRWRAGLPPPPASIPSPASHPARSTPTTRNVPMFPQDARDVMMSAPAEMTKRTSWITKRTVHQEVVSRHHSHLQQANTDPHLITDKQETKQQRTVTTHATHPAPGAAQ